jgi:hypothetical protein
MAVGSSREQAIKIHDINPKTTTAAIIQPLRVITDPCCWLSSCLCAIDRIMVEEILSNICYPMLSNIRTRYSTAVMHQG